MRRRLAVGTSGALALLLVLSVAGGWEFARSTRLTDSLSRTDTPALVAAAQLEEALVSQETAVRGYGLTGQRSFLQPYTDGLVTQRRETAVLRSLLTDDTPASGELDALLAQVETWQSRFARPIAVAPQGAPVALAAQRADEGKREFDTVRAAGDRLQQALTTRRDKSRADLRRADTERDWIFGFIAAVIALLAVLVFVALRRGVTRPLGRLAYDVRTIADGRFDHVVTPTGPSDIRALALDVEYMRDRMVEALALRDLAHARLDEQTADLRRSNAELEQFAYVASHDLQEPLRKVASFCQLLERRYADQLDERAVQYIGFAVDGANRMQTLINDLLAFSRVGRVHAETAEVDLEELFARTVESHSLAIADAGAEITHDPLPVVHGDATQLGMLLQNLLSNALKFRSPDRPPRIDVSVVPRSEDEWEFAVTDNGIGIAPEFAERVFVIFQRLHTRDDYPGNGIGLALCKKIVDFHGGAIAIDPEHEQGTRFVFTLPRSASSADQLEAELLDAGVLDAGVLDVGSPGVASSDGASSDPVPAGAAGAAGDSAGGDGTTAARAADSGGARGAGDAEGVPDGDARAEGAER
ncbi:sensor histidine kinase [Actinacidiphila rubida]|uniref:sensor histidine kinase n=1 Tax=Actinacidiphila rubida TaxID=310780 RepID=UPI000849E5B2|nr:ATP-binding protein [Actinacidiphila rubida]